MPVTPALKEYAQSKVGNAVNNFSNVIREASADQSLIAGGLVHAYISAGVRLWGSS